MNQQTEYYVSIDNTNGAITGLPSQILWARCFTSNGYSWGKDQRSASPLTKEIAEGLADGIHQRHGIPSAVYASGNIPDSLTSNPHDAYDRAMKGIT